MHKLIRNETTKDKTNFITIMYIVRESGKYQQRNSVPVLAACLSQLIVMRNVQLMCAQKGCALSTKTLLSAILFSKLFGLSDITEITEKIISQTD